jgi:hypothetical protein
VETPRPGPAPSASRSPAGTAVDIQLFQAANVIRNANGTVSFVDADGDNRADPGTPVVNGATLSGVNGVPGGTANGVVSNGTVTFTVTGGTAQDSVVPVIFADTNTTTGSTWSPPQRARPPPRSSERAVRSRRYHHLRPGGRRARRLDADGRFSQRQPGLLHRQRHHRQRRRRHDDHELHLPVRR